MNYEHVNSASEIENVLRYFFADVRCSVFGLGRSLSFYQFYVCSLPTPRPRPGLFGSPRLGAFSALGIAACIK